MPPRKITAHLVSKTHWDREWYRPFEEFRFHLVRLVDRLLYIFETQPGYRHYDFDGQTIVLEDYLEIRPENEEILRKHIKSGRLAVGPWYNLPDAYIPGGETHVRNLLMGRRVAKRFGKISNAGYIPDPFGHPAQMPQIMNGFGIESYIFTRGMPRADDFGTEFLWQAPDGRSEVIAVWQKNLYINASLLGYDQPWGDSEQLQNQYSTEKAVNQIKDQANDLGALTNTDAILLTNGCDHTPPQFEIPDIIRAANRKLKSTRVVHSTFDKYISEIQKSHAKMKQMQGELRSSRYIYVLPGVLSARLYLKKWNRRCEALLERWAEPTSEIARRLGGEDHSPYLLKAWRLLLENQPHDSICGCSTDAVHREMVTRYEKCDQMTRVVVEHNFKYINSRIDTRREGAESSLIVWNPLPGRYRGPCVSTLTIPARISANFQIVNGNGEVVPHQIKGDQEIMDTPFLAFWQKYRRGEISFELPMEGLGYQTLWIEPSTQKRSIEDAWASAATTKSITTDHYRVTFNSNGSFEIYDRDSRARHRRLHIFEDTEDVGDEYDYSHAENSRTFTTEKSRAKIRITERGPIYVEYEITIPWRIPRSANNKRTGRVGAKVDMTITTNLRVYRRHRRIDLTTLFNNQANDHRLRVHFDAPTNAKHSLADGHFAWIERPLQVKTTKKHSSPEPVTHHMRHFVALTDKKIGLAVLNRSLTEYEILTGKRGSKTIAVTLLRSVGFLSKGDLLTRKNFAGPEVETPEAQCIGPNTTKYALYPFAGRDFASDLAEQAESFAAPTEIRTEEIHDGELLSAKKFVHMKGEGLIWSAWKPAESGKGSIVRFYNPTDKPTNAKIIFDSAWSIDGACDLKEDLLKKPAAKGKKKRKSTSGRVGACEIRSYRLT